MATQVSLNDGAVASAGALAIQTNGTTQAVSISTGQVATLAQNPILTSGTANGVAYLNTSKQVTTGSALVFDGTNLNLSIKPTNDGGYGLDIYRGNSGGYLDSWARITDASGVMSFQQIDTSSSAGFNWKLSSNSGSSFTTPMTLDASGNLGIGVTTVGAKLHVLAASQSAIFASTSASLNYTEYRYNTTTVNGYIGNGGILTGSGSATDFVVRSEAALAFATGGATERARIDSSGNLGLGVTPSAWTSVFKAVQVKQGSISTDSSNNTTFANNCYFDGSNWKYINTAASQQYLQYAGQHIWNTAPSGTGGVTPDTVSFTQAMTLDASGNLLVGQTSGTSYKLSLKTSSASQSAIGTAGTSGDTAFQAILITKFDNDSTTSQNFIQFQINNGGANCGKITANGANTAAFGSTSDQRVKENIVELPSQLANIMALRPVEFDYLESYGGGHQIGFIAQEMQQVYPDVISTDDSSEQIMSITGWSKTEARLVKAIQELKAEFDAYKASHP